MHFNHYNGSQCMFCVMLFLGWSWDSQDRPTFSEIHKWLNNVFSTSSVDEGNKVFNLAYFNVSYLY